MTIEVALVISFAIVCIAILTKSFVNDKKQSNDVMSSEEKPIIEEPIESGEMPIKPKPVNCRYAQFRPAPEKFSYFDCCGNLQEGEGFQPWEKRSPVPVDINKPFEGMDVHEDEAIVDC